MQCVQVAFSMGVKWLGHETDHSPESSDEVKNGVNCTPPLHLCAFMECTGTALLQGLKINTSLQGYVA
jgi:hypothetical protein